MKQGGLIELGPYLELYQTVVTVTDSTILGFGCR